MKNDLLSYSRFEDRSPFFYIEHAIIEQYEKSIMIIDKEGKAPIPICTIACLLLGPGTKITHQAILNATEAGCTVIWTGEEGVRFYASGLGISVKSKNILLQASLFSDEEQKLRIARKLYQMRFNELIPEEYNLNQIRGIEGNRVRSAYKKLSEEYKIDWEGRNYDRNNWDYTNPINRAITAANSCIYGVCTTAVISLGFSTAIGFVHSGFSTAFVCDIADLYKVSEIFPIAFATTAEGVENLEKRVRYACRDYFKKTKILSRIVDNLKEVFDGCFDTGEIISCDEGRTVEMDDTI